MPLLDALQLQANGQPREATTSGSDVTLKKVNPGDLQVDRRDLMVEGGVQNLKVEGENVSTVENPHIRNIPNEVLVGYEDFFETYLKGALVDMKDTATIHDREYQHDQELLAMFLNEQGNLDTAKIKAFVRTTKGIGIVDAIMAEDATLYQKAIGQVARANHQMNIDAATEGTWNLFRSKKKGRNADIPAFSLETNKYAFDALTDSEKKRLKNRGFDLDDFQWNTSVLGLEVLQEKDATLRPVKTSSMTPQDIEQRILQGVHLREQLLISLGFDLSEIGVPGQFVMQYGAADGPEKIPLHWMKRTMQEFKPNNGGFVRGQPEQNIRRWHDAQVRVISSEIKAYIGEQLQKVDDAGRLSAIDARITAREGNSAQQAERVQRLTEQKTQLETDRQSLTTEHDKLTELDAAIGEVREAGKYKGVEAKRKGITEAHGIVQKDSAALVAYEEGVQGLGSAEGGLDREARRKELETERQALHRLQQTMQQYEQALDKLDTAKAQAGAGVTSSLEAGIESEKLYAKIFGKKNKNSLPRRRREEDKRYEAELKDFELQLEAEKTAGLKGSALESKRQAGKRRIEKKHTDTLRLLVNEEGVLTAKKAEVDKAYTYLEDAEKTFTTEGKNGEALLASTAADFAELTALEPGILNEEDLRTLTPDQILQKINSINALDPKKGWPKSQNGDEIFRNKLTNAVVEARAREISPVMSTPSAEFTELTTGLWGISEHQLISLEPMQLDRLISDKIHADAGLQGVPRPTEQQFAQARVEARQRMIARKDAIRAQQRVNEDLKNNLSAMPEAGRKHTEAKKQVGDTEKIVRDGTTVLDRMHSDYAAIVQLDRLGVVGLNRTVLATESVDEILRRINQINGVHANAGWPESRNSNPETIAHIHRAIAEAKAQEREVHNPDYTARQAGFITLRNLGLSEQQLRTLSIDQIVTHARDAERQRGGAWDANIEAHMRRAAGEASTQARVRLYDRSEALKEQEGHAKTAAENIDSTLPIPPDAAQKLAAAEAKITGDLVSQAEAINRNVMKDYSEINRGSGRYGATTINLSDTALATLPMHELLNQINLVHGIDSSRGWSVAQNNDPEMRKRLEHAIVEARARQAEPAMTSRIIERLTSPAGWKFSEHDIRTMSVDQLAAAAKQKQTIDPALGGVALPSRHDLEQAKIDVDRRYTARTRAYEDTTEALRREGNEIEAQKNPANLSIERTQLQGVKRMLQNKGEIMRSANEMFVKPEAYFNNTRISATEEGFTQAERDAQLPLGYFKLLDTMFGYQASSDREAQFKAYQAMATPELLALALRDTVDHIMPRAVPRNLPLDRMFVWMDNMLKAGDIGSTVLRQGLKTTMDNIYNRAVVL